MALENAPLDEEGFALTDRWYCEDTQTWYPAGTSIREIRNDMEPQKSYVLVRSEDGTLNHITCRHYYTLWAAQQAMGADFVNEYMEFYDTTEPPMDEDNDRVYIYGGDRAVLCMDEPDTPEWAIVELEV